MAKQRTNGNMVLAVGVAAFLFVSWVASVIATAWQSWLGRVVVVAALGGLIAISVTAFRWVRRRRRIRAQTLGDLLALTPSQFEHAVGQLLRDQGYGAVQVSGRAGDMQADVRARTPQGKSVIVQCKRYAPGNKVGSPAIQSFIGMAHVHHRAAVGMFVTTSTFTEPATRLARKHKIRLVDGPDLVRQFVQAEAVRQSSPQAADSTPEVPPPPPPAPRLRDRSSRSPGLHPRQRPIDP